MKWRGGGARDKDMHTTIKQITQRGGVVGNDDDNNNDDDDNDNSHDEDDDDNDDDVSDDDGRCGGRDCYPRMRKGRGHNDRTNTTIK